jgi:hypothetical protein
MADIVTVRRPSVALLGCAGVLRPCRARQGALELRRRGRHHADRQARPAHQANGGPMKTGRRR